MKHGNSCVRTCVRTLLAVSTLGLAATAAQAVTTTWEFKGTLTTNTVVPAGPDTPDIQAGMPFRMLVTFDTAAPFTTRNSSNDPVTGLPRPGLRYQYFGTPSLKLAFYAGGCNPCIPTSIPSRNTILVRDNFADLLRNGAEGSYDGYSFGMEPDPANDNTGFLVVIRDRAELFNPEVVNVTGPLPLPVEPDARLPQMALSLVQIYNDGDDLEPGTADDVFVEGKIESVGIPTYGTAFVLTGRDCSYPDFANFSSGTPIEVYDDCIVQGRGGAFNRFQEEGGGPGQGDFSRTTTLEFPTWTAAPPAALRSLGTVFASATFGGPAALPVVKAFSYPIDVARTNGNVQAYQQYRYTGNVATEMPLVADLTYQIDDNFVLPSNPNPSISDQSLSPGVAGLSATLAIVDGNVISAADMSSGGFAHRNCGSEAFQRRADGSPWPAGAIMGTAAYQSIRGESGPQARVVSVVRCAASGETANADGTVVTGDAVSLAPNQAFYVVTTMQTPARGMWQQTANTSPAPAADGYTDAASTFRVTIDPQAPPEVIAGLVSNLSPVCEDCEFTPDERILRIDVKPDSNDNAISPGSQGVIPVAIFGSLGLPVDWIAIGSLRLGGLGLKINNAGKPLCSQVDVDSDGILDLMCHFQNQRANWQAGQTVVELTGTLTNSEPIRASETVRIVP